MNQFTICCLVFLYSLKGLAQDDFIDKSVEIFQSSELSITGDTNISKFGCEFNTFYLEQRNEIKYDQHGNQIIFKDAILTLKNEGFDCGNKGINKDFHALLKTKEYPKITLELTEIILDNDSGIASVKIKIACKENTYQVPVAIFNTGAHRFVGKLKLNISDFNLEPPKKFLGLIVIKEDIEINFNLVAGL